jgi:DNA replication protein DnaC
MMHHQTGIGKETKVKLPLNTLDAISDQAATGCMRSQFSVLTVRPSASAAHPSHHQAANGFRTQRNTPYYTPTPRYSRGDSAMENTPHQLKDVTEFSLYPTGAQGVGISPILPSSGAKTRRQGDLTNRGHTAGKQSLRTKSLTATTQKKSATKIPRLNSLTAKKVERNSKSALGFMTTSKNLLPSKTRRNELPRRSTNTYCSTTATK